MVELEEAVCATTIEASSPAEIYLCRLCLKDEENAVNIFEEGLEEKDVKKTPLVQRLYELLQIKYEKSVSLSPFICQRCLYIVETFTSFRESVHKCEAELQERLRLLKLEHFLSNEENRPGLNGNPGLFEIDDDCEITEVNPDQEYESSEDDFSMESDSESEILPSGAQQPVLPSAPLKTEQPVETFSAPLLTTVQNEVHSLDSTSNVKNELATKLLHANNDMHTFSTNAASNTLTDSISNEYTKNTFLCQFCDMAFVTQADCAEHESRHDANAPFLCNFCSLRAANRQTLIVHIKELHDPERPYVCALCNKGFCRRSDLKKHTIVHTGVRPFTCSVCAKCFSRNTNLTKHMRIHSSLRPHVCQRCPRSFTTANELLRHARSHTETKPFQCTRCPSSFTRKDKLQLHEQAHNRRESEFLLNQAKTASIGSMAAGCVPAPTAVGAAAVNHQMENIVVALNPYGEQQDNAVYPAANIVAPTFNEDPYRHSILAAQLQQRSMQAAPAKPTPIVKHSRLYSCEICSKSFTRERDLNRHKALHLDSLFTCKQCNIGFNRREKLARHEQEHHAPQYPCNICRMTFTKTEELEMHRKMHELQQNVALATQAALGAAAVNNAVNILNVATPPTVAATLPPSIPRDLHHLRHASSMRPTPADLSFYSQMVPTMNLGFYSETRPEDRNGI